MPLTNTPLIIRRAAQLKALAKVRNTLPRADRVAVTELYELPVENMQDWQLELVDSLAATYLSEVARC